MNKPSDEISVKLDGQTETKFFMSYGLLDELVGICGDLDKTVEILTDKDLRSQTLKTLLTPRNEFGEPVPEAETPRVSDHTEVVKLLTWASEHCFYFFAQATEHTGRLMTVMHEKVVAMMPPAALNS